MKIVQSHRRNKPSTLNGYSITVFTTYSSFDPTEIDELEKKMPEGISFMEVKEKPQDCSGHVEWKG